MGEDIQGGDLGGFDEKKGILTSASASARDQTRRDDETNQVRIADLRVE
jgi:hypothetical protein